MNYLDKKYNKFLNEKSYEVLQKNKEYMEASQKAEDISQEIKNTITAFSKLIGQFDDCLTKISSITSREYFKQGLKTK